jgi:purine catabolism regulator
VAAAPADDLDGMAIARRIADHLGRTVAVSRPFGEPGERPAAEAAARATLEAAVALPDPPPIAVAARLPAYLLLGSLRNVPDGQRQAHDLLAPVLVGRPERQAERLETLRAVLGSASMGDAAERLGVHRNTIAYRVRRLEALTGWDLGDPDLRYALETAVRIVQSAQS